MTRRYPLGDVKILWGLAAGRCSFPGCREICIAPPSAADAVAVIGDIAHIAAHSSKGPRPDPSFPADAIDTYANWILLCPKHHRLVDAQPNTHDSTTLLRWKAEHESWVAERLGGAGTAVPPVQPQVTMTLYRVVAHDSDAWEGRAPAGDARWADSSGFSVRYAAESPTVAIVEATARFGPAPGPVERMSQLLHGQLKGWWSPESSSEESAKWLSGRKMAIATVSGTFADIEDDAVRQYVEAQTRALTGSSLEETSEFGAGRRALQEAKVLFASGKYDGIIYPSRLGSKHRMIALFSSAVVALNTFEPIDSKG